LQALARLRNASRSASHWRLGKEVFSAMSMEARGASKCLFLSWSPARKSRSVRAGSTWSGLGMRRYDVTPATRVTNFHPWDLR
jgi:hypothetical protein